MENFGEKLKVKIKKDRTAGDIEPEEAIKKLEEADPTTQKNYIPWLVKLYTGTDVWMEDILSSVNTALITFNTLKNRNLLGADADIGKIKTRHDLYNVVARHENKLEDVKDKDVKINDEIAGKYKHVFKGKTIDIYIPLDFTASKYFARGTHWCTARENFWLSYTKDGPLYDVIPKFPKKYSTDIKTLAGNEERVSRIEKYQIHLHSQQCKDLEDHKFRFPDLVEKFPEVATYFRTIPGFREHPLLKYCLSDEETKKNWDAEQKKLKQKRADDLSNLLSNIMRD